MTINSGLLSMGYFIGFGAILGLTFGVVKGALIFFEDKYEHAKHKESKLKD